MGSSLPMISLLLLGPLVVLAPLETKRELTAFLKTKYFVSFFHVSNYNYGQAGRSLGLNLLNNPDLVATDAVISFKTAIWFWMTPQENKPSGHNVIIGIWQPSDVDRIPGDGVITNIINGGIECEHGLDYRVADRIGFYKRYCDILGVSYGNNLECYNQRSFA